MADFHTVLRRKRSEIEERLDHHSLLHTLSAARMQLGRATVGAITRWAFGRVLEAGSGRSPHQKLLAERSESITRLDIDSKHAPDIVGDVQQMDTVQDGSFDTVLSTQVLEHVPRPHAAFSEFARVLRPGGVLILTAPHLSMIHEAPHDYFRYTRFGLGELCRANAFQIIELRDVGGIVSLASHVVSVAVLTTLGTLPGLFWIIWSLNYVFFVRGVDLLDRLVGMRSLLPRDYLLVARRV